MLYMVDFDRELPIKGYVLALPSGEESVWCEECYDESAVSGTLFTKIIRKGQYRAGNRRCDDCGSLV